MKLETILREHFGCQRPVLKKPMPLSYAYHRRHLTSSGARAYGRLISIIYALEHLLPELVNAEEIIEALDEMADGLTHGLRESEEE